MNKEAEKFFESLPSEASTEKFDLNQALKEEKEVTPEVQPAPKPEKAEEIEEEEEEKKEKRPNRQERRREQNRFWEEQLARERERAERLETELLKRSAPTQEEEDARLTRLFGDTPQGKEASRIVSELLKETEERAVAPYRQLEQQQLAEAEQEVQFGKQIEDGIDTIYDEYGIDLDSRSMKDTRNEFLDFVDELSPDDSLVNFGKAWSLFQANQKAPKDPEVVQRKKEIASRSMQRSTKERPDVQVSRPSFGDWDRIKSRLLGK